MDSEGMALLRRMSKDQRGLLSRLAKELGIKRAAVAQWHRIPVDRARRVSAFTNIPLHKLRPDIWPSDPAD